MRMTATDWFLLGLLSVLWGGTFFFVAIAVREVPPLTVVLLRVAIAAAALFVLLKLAGVRLPSDRRVWQAFLAMGFLNNVIPFSLFFWAQTTITGGLASIANATTPIFSIAIAHFLLADERFTPNKFAGVVLAVVGVGFLVGEEISIGLGMNTDRVSGEIGISIEGGGNFVANSGTITGLLIAAPIESSANIVENSGTILSARGLTGRSSLQGSDAPEIIHNSGLITGGVDLGGSKDLFESKLGEIAAGIHGGSGEDTIVGSNGDDSISGDHHGDLLKGRLGDDEISGGHGADLIRGGQGEDRLLGDGGKDGVFGGRGDDDLDGGNGDDKLGGGRDDDELTGGLGQDVFVFKLKAGDDRITDFEDGIDRIDLTAYKVTANAVDQVISNVGNDAVVDLDQLGGKGTLLLDAAAGDLDSADFLL